MGGSRYQDWTSQLRAVVMLLAVCLMPLMALMATTGCAGNDYYNEPPPRVVTHPRVGCNAYPPNQVGENSYHIARDDIVCPEPLPALTSSAGGARANKVLLTTDLIREMKLSGQQVSSLQFYTSHRIILQRELAGADQFVEGGRLVTRDGRYIDQVLIERGTPGVATQVSPNAITIDFGQGSPLRFGTPPGPIPSNPAHRAYRLMGFGWEGNNTGRVYYDNTVYRLVGPSHVAALLIDQDELSKKTTQRRVLPGKTLFDNTGYSYEFDENYGAYVPRAY